MLGNESISSGSNPQQGCCILPSSSTLRKDMHLTILSSAMGKSSGWMLTDSLEAAAGNERKSCKEI